MPIFGIAICFLNNCKVLQPHLDVIQLYDQLELNSYSNFINYRKNKIVFKGTAMDRFFYALTQVDRKQVKIVHLGDSHVQADTYPGYVRKRLQAAFGSSGRGLVFPYASANTHATYDYSTGSTGYWASNRNIFPSNGIAIGLAGAGIKTNDQNAGFSIRFLRPENVPDSDRVKIYCQKGQTSYGITVRTDSGEMVQAECSDTSPIPSKDVPVAPAGPALSYAELKLQKPATVLSFQLSKTKKEQNSFACSGISLENNCPGILYHSGGINGAHFADFLRQDLIIGQLKEMDPDLIILELGINDILNFMASPAAFNSDVRRALAHLQQGAPNSSFILMNLGEVYLNGVNQGVSERYTANMAGLADELGVGFYDTYGVEGGPGSMVRWFQNGMARNDFIHLTYSGYFVRGELLANALIEGYMQYLRRK